MKRINKTCGCGILALLLVCSALFSGCGGGRMPDPASRDVKQLVLTLSMKAIRNALLPEVGSDVTGMALETMLRYGYPEFDFDIWQSLRGESKQIGLVVSQIEERTKDLDLRLENVRVVFRNEDLRRVVCLGEIHLSNGNRLNIRYLAQYNEAHELYAEVELLP
jgi:hypothetical protein